MNFNQPIIATLFILFSLVSSGDIQVDQPVLSTQNQDLQDIKYEQFDLDGDEQPDITVVSTAFFSGQDKILVYDQEHNSQWSGQLDEAVDFSDDVWLFDVEGDGSAQLIIDFEATDVSLSAMIYDDLDGDGIVDYEVRDDEIEITESDNWHARITINSPEWPQSAENFPDMLIELDGPTLRYLEWGEAQPAGTWAIENIKTDGNIDWTLEIKDLDRNDIPDYQLQRALVNFPYYYSVFRSTLYVNENKKTPMPYPDFIIWPLLVSKHGYESYNYFDHLPALAIDWEKAQIDRIGVIGYPSENGFHINSRAATWERGEVNYADFENPMAYYDLANDQDGKPELFVRFEVFKKNDPIQSIYAGHIINDPVTQVEYAWDVDDNDKWDYELSFANRKPVESVVDFDGYLIKTIPYQTIPNWVGQQNWEIATFVASEDGGYWNSEGLAEWSVSRGYKNGVMVEPSELRTDYLTGYSNQPPAENYQDIRENMRGEYNFAYFDTPKMYINSLDRRLHLHSAQSGVYNMGEGKYIRYANLDGDAYLDEWREEVEGEVVQRLNYSGGFYVYSGNGVVTMKRVDLQPAVFETLPPANNAEWQELAELLAASRTELAQNDFNGMLRLLNGTEMRVRGAAVRDFRLTKQGWRCVLSLWEGYNMEGENWLGITGGPPGDYVVAYEGKFSVQPLTPPSLRMVPSLGESQKLPEIALQIGEVPFRIYNDGLEDAQVVVARLSASLDGEVLFESLPMTVTVGGGESTLLNFQWAPTAEGEWVLRAEARIAGHKAAPATASQTLLAAAAEQINWEQALSALGLLERWQSALLGLMLGAAVFACSGLFIRMLARERGRNERRRP